jgi:hypothetical protein
MRSCYRATESSGETECCVWCNRISRSIHRCRCLPTAASFRLRHCGFRVLICRRIFSQHGPVECEANAFLSCVAQRYPAEHDNFVHCLDWSLIFGCPGGCPAPPSFAMYHKFAENCSTVLGLNHSALQSCATGEDGLELVLAAARKTAPYQHTYVPWLVRPFLLSLSLLPPLFLLPVFLACVLLPRTGVRRNARDHSAGEEQAHAPVLLGASAGACLGVVSPLVFPSSTLTLASFLQVINGQHNAAAEKSPQSFIEQVCKAYADPEALPPVCSKLPAPAGHRSRDEEARSSGMFYYAPPAP